MCSGRSLQGAVPALMTTCMLVVQVDPTGAEGLTPGAPFQDPFVPALPIEVNCRLNLQLCCLQLSCRWKVKVVTAS